jgi:hypothetical protein
MLTAPANFLLRGLRNSSMRQVHELLRCPRPVIAVLGGSQVRMMMLPRACVWLYRCTSRA